MEPYRDRESFFRQAGIKAELAPDIRFRLWEKFAFVCPFATLTALYDRTIGEILADRAHRKQLLELTEEIRELARCEGVRIPASIRKDIMNRAGMIPPETTTSLQLDFRQGKNTEIDIFTGYVVKMAAELGIPAPLHTVFDKKLREKLPTPG